jgi:hypothetical protein
MSFFLSHYGHFFCTFCSRFSLHCTVEEGGKMTFVPPRLGILQNWTLTFFPWPRPLKGRPLNSWALSPAFCAAKHRLEQLSLFFGHTAFLPKKSVWKHQLLSYEAARKIWMSVVEYQLDIPVTTTYQKKILKFLCAKYLIIILYYTVLYCIILRILTTEREIDS